MFEATAKIYDPMTGLWTAASTHERQFQGRASSMEENRIYYNDMHTFFTDTRDCLAIVTERGLGIIVDKESRVMTDSGPVKARKLVEGDKIATPVLLQSYNNNVASDLEMTQMLMQIVEHHLVPSSAYMLSLHQTSVLLSGLRYRLSMFKHRDLAENIQRLFMKMGLVTSVLKNGERWSVVPVEDTSGVDEEIYWDKLVDVFDVGEEEVWGTTIVRDHNLCVNGIFVEDA